MATHFFKFIKIMNISLIISFLLTGNVMAKNVEPQVLRVFESYRSLNTKEFLQEGLKLAKTQQEITLLKNAIKKIDQIKWLGEVNFGKSLDAIGYLLLTHLEKDFIRFPTVYQLYLGFKSFFRGKKLLEFNKKCVYSNKYMRRAFSLTAFAKGRRYGCKRPKEMIGKTTEKNFQQMEEVFSKALTYTDKFVSKNSKKNKNYLASSFNSMLGLLFPSANAYVSDKFAIAAAIGIGVSVVGALLLGAALVVGGGILAATGVLTPVGAGMLVGGLVIIGAVGKGAYEAYKANR